MIEVDVTQQSEAATDLWDHLGSVAVRLPAGWVLVGGLMVQLHALEQDAAQVVRVTTDIDLLGQARHPENLTALAAALIEQDFVVGEPDLDGYSHRLVRDDVVIDLLAPDGVKRRIEIVPGTSTVGIPGGTQALNRAEQVRVRTTSSVFNLLRPSLLGGILLKARSVEVHRERDAQIFDLARLLSLVDDPFVLRTELRASERKWLRRVQSSVGEVPSEFADSAETTLAVLVASET